MKAKCKVAFGIVLLLVIVSQAAAVSKIGFLDPYWIVRHLFYHGCSGDTSDCMGILRDETGYFPLLEDSLGLTMTWSLCDPWAVSLLSGYDLKLASEWYPDSTWKYVIAQQELWETGGDDWEHTFEEPSAVVGEFWLDPGPEINVVRSLRPQHTAGDIIPETQMGWGWLGGNRMYNYHDLPGGGVDTLFFEFVFKWDSATTESTIAQLIINPLEEDDDPPIEKISLRDHSLLDVENQTRGSHPFPTDTLEITCANAQNSYQTYDTLILPLAHKWRTEGFRLKVHWPRTHHLYIDKLEIYDRAYRHLFYDTARDTTLDSVAARLKDYDQSAIQAHYNFRIDEPGPRCFDGYATVYDEYDAITSGREISIMLNPYQIDNGLLVDSLVIPNTLFFFNYTLGGDSFQGGRMIDEDTRIESFFTSHNSDVAYIDSFRNIENCNHYPTIHSLQHGWDKLAGSPDEGEEYEWGLYKMREIAEEVNRPWQVYLQAGQIIHDPYGVTFISNRDPTQNEIHCQAWLALSYKPNGIGWYRTAGSMFQVDLGVEEGNDCCPARSEQEHGLLDWAFEGGSYADGPTDYGDGRKYRTTERFYAAKAVHAMLDTIGPYLDVLQWEASEATRAFKINNSFPWLLPGNPQTFLESIESFEIDNGVWNESAEHQDSSYIQIGIFTDNPPVYDSWYLMLVNRRCLSDETRGIKYQMNMNGRFNPFFVHHILGNSIRLVQPDGLGKFDDSLVLAPGRGELIHIKPWRPMEDLRVMIDGDEPSLKWSSTAGAEIYFVEATSNGGKDFEVIATTTDTTFADTLGTSKSRVYRISAYVP